MHVGGEPKEAFGPFGPGTKMMAAVSFCTMEPFFIVSWSHLSTGSRSVISCGNILCFVTSDLHGHVPQQGPLTVRCTQSWPLTLLALGSCSVTSGSEAASGWATRLYLLQTATHGKSWSHFRVLLRSDSF